MTLQLTEEQLRQAIVYAIERTQMAVDSGEPIDYAAITEDVWNLLAQDEAAAEGLAHLNGATAEGN